LVHDLIWVTGAHLNLLNNAANARAQVITAAGEGSAAAIALNADLVADDVAAAVKHAADAELAGARPARSLP
jgi:hypothetical protein